MVIDDDAEILRATEEMLRLIGRANTVCFQSPSKAVEAFRQAPGEFDLVITDFDMPGMDGADVCHSIREANRSQKIILFTGSHQVHAEDALALGFDYFLPKPVALSSLELALDATLGPDSHFRLANNKNKSRESTEATV